MARIRTIKPEMPHSESIGRLSREARLLFLQLFMVVDDDGRTRASLPYLCGQLYPYDSDAIHCIAYWLAELVREKHIRYYSVDGNHYLDIPKWQVHQKISHPTKSRLPSVTKGKILETSGDFAKAPE